MDWEMFDVLAAAGRDEVERLSRQLGKPIDVDHSAIYMLARIAIHKTDGEAYMRDHVRILVEDMIRRCGPKATAYKYEYEPPDADARRQTGHAPPGVSFQE